MNTPEIVTVACCTAWTVAVVTVMRSMVRGWKINRRPELVPKARALLTASKAVRRV